MTPEEHKREHKRLQKLTHRNQMRLIDSELSLSQTMWDLAKTEMKIGDEAHAKVLLHKVEEAIQTVRERLADGYVSDDERSEIEGRLEELTNQLGAAKAGGR
jgi:hypothetical protein